jgi:hypothetical protein
MKKSELKQIIKEEISKILKEDKLTFKKDGTVVNPDGIYILGGLSGDGWNEKSMGKAKVLYYTDKPNDPELKNFREDGMVRVIIKDNSVIDVVEY